MIHHLASVLINLSEAINVSCTIPCVGEDLTLTERNERKLSDCFSVHSLKALWVVEAMLTYDQTSLAFLELILDIVRERHEIIH